MRITFSIAKLVIEALSFRSISTCCHDMIRRIISISCSSSMLTLGSMLSCLFTIRTFIAIVSSTTMRISLYANAIFQVFADFALLLMS